MIKRRFFRFEHGNRDDPSGSSSSSDESEVEGDASDGSEVEEDIGSDIIEKGESSSSSGYETEDSSAHEDNLDSSDLPTSDDDVKVQNIIGGRSKGKSNTELATAHRSSEKYVASFDTLGCVLKRKSVFKCRLCPAIVCLSEETLKAHLNSKRHARSEKLLKEGRLKRMLNEAGKVEEETYSDNPDTSPGDKSAKPKKKKKGPWKRKKGPRQETKLENAKPKDTELEKAKPKDTESEKAKPKDKKLEKAKPKDTQLEKAKPKDKKLEKAKLKDKKLEKARPSTNKRQKRQKDDS